MALDQMPDTVANRSDRGRRPYTQPKISSKASARVVDGRHDAVYGLVPTLAPLAESGLIQPQMAGNYPPPHRSRVYRQTNLAPLFLLCLKQRSLFSCIRLLSTGQTIFPENFKSLLPPGESG